MAADAADTRPALKFSTVAGGVWVEDLPDSAERTGSERCFRFDAQGRAEWASLADLVENGERARWFGHVYTAADFVLC